MSRFAWIVTVPITVLIVLFAVSNRQGVTIDLFPFAVTLQAPLFVVVLVSLVLGVVCGAAIEAVRGHKTRKALKDANRKAEALSEHVAALKAKTPPVPSLPAASPMGTGGLQPGPSSNRLA
jgi:uncharacterized integral membrane protein